MHFIYFYTSLLNFYYHDSIYSLYYWCAFLLFNPIFFLFFSLSFYYLLLMSRYPTPLQSPTTEVIFYKMRSKSSASIKSNFYHYRKLSAAKKFNINIHKNIVIQVKFFFFIFLSTIVAYLHTNNRR